jgi:hypothetical protein
VRGRRCFATALAALALGCEGSGQNGDGLVVHQGRIDGRCTPVAGSFPSGFSLVPGVANRAALVQFAPPALVPFDLDPDAPRVLASVTVPPDSDGDGVADTQRSQQEGFLPLGPVMGELSLPDAGLALQSTSNYEQVLFADPLSGAPRSATVENPAASAGYRPEDYPFLPDGGTSAVRKGVSTRACIYPGAGALDSGGVAIAADARCDPAEPTSFFTTLTAGKAVAAGRLFVATSNLRNSGQARFYPGTVLVYALEAPGGALGVRPETAAPVLFTTAFNPTGVLRHVTASGRELVLVTATGAIGADTGASNLRTPAAVDVIDAAALRIAASIPLGFAGPSFDALSVDPSRRIAVLGSSSLRELYAVDLAALDDARLYEGDGPPVVLDGLTTGFPDARIFDADHPLVLPDRADGAPPAECAGFTHAAVNASGREIFATDFCDGTLTRIGVDLSGSPPVPVPRERFTVRRQESVFAAIRDDSLGLLRGPGTLRVRPGVPAVDYTGPDVFIVVGLPEAQLCGMRVESPRPPGP